MAIFYIKYLLVWNCFESINYPRLSKRKETYEAFILNGVGINNT